MSQIPRGMRKGVAVGKYDWQKEVLPLNA